MNFLKKNTINTSNNILTEIVCQGMPFTAASPTAAGHSQLSGIISFCIFIKEFKVLGRKVQLVETRPSGCLFPAMKPWGGEASFRSSSMTEGKMLSPSTLYQWGVSSKWEKGSYKEFHRILLMAKICYFLFATDLFK